MNYYLYRLQFADFTKLENSQSITFDYIPPECAQCSDGDVIIVYVSQTLEVLGMYTKKGDAFVLTEKSKDKTIRDIWEAFDFVQEITETTTRLFKKKMREISKEEFEKAQELL